MSAPVSRRFGQAHRFAPTVHASESRSKLESGTGFYRQLTACQDAVLNNAILEIIHAEKLWQKLELTLAKQMAYRPNAVIEQRKLVAHTCVNPGC